MTRGLWYSLWYKKIWRGRSRGLSTVIGTVFLTLVIFAISTNVFIWTLSRNADYTQAVREENQQNVDRQGENVIAYNANYTVSEDKVRIKVTLKNAGSMAVHIINLWIFDTDHENQRYANKSCDYGLSPGQVLYLRDELSPTVIIPGANASHRFVSWFVTARGNTVPVADSEDVIVAEIAQGIGSISMDFPTFRYYEVIGYTLGPAQYSFNLPAKRETIIGVVLTNLDPRRQDIIISKYSCFWLSVPPKNAMAYWSIVKVEGEKFLPLDFQRLEYGSPTLVHFGPAKAEALAGHQAAANILLYGTIGDEDYGQNIPFISLYLS
ncbi:MAG: hypothetical protein JSV57_01865 [Candidatus Bathyarchaeota archaeon]|nr:MAG: hypothetical protein JSV57_01865 [Candidatus Bathyarchaeota archaeon]